MGNLARACPACIVDEESDQELHIKLLDNS